MICPGPDEDSYKICLICKACYPGLSPRVQELLDVTIVDHDKFYNQALLEIKSLVELVEEVMA